MEACHGVGWCHSLRLRVMASANMTIIEARRMLEVADVAWRVDDYRESWQALSREFSLEERFSALQAKVTSSHENRQRKRMDFREEQSRIDTALQSLVRGRGNLLPPSLRALRCT